MPRIGLLWRQEWDPPRSGEPIRSSCRLQGVFAAFAALGVEADPVVYGDDRVADVREQLLGLDGVLVWVNPIEQGLDRTRLDPLLREVAAAGVWVSAHPDVIMRLATKRVLYETQAMSWGTETRLYLSAVDLHERLPVALAVGARVLKQARGMGGQGVWKVVLERPSDDPLLHVQHATRDAPLETLSLSAFVARCAPYFENGGSMVDQPYQERVADGMIRVYLTHDEVVGYAHQYPAGLRPAGAGAPPPGKTFELPDTERFARLRGLVEGRWVPELLDLLELGRTALPVIWDIDFLFGPRDEHGDDTFVLCEINASSTFAFPESAMPRVAAAALQRVAERVSDLSSRASSSPSAPGS